MKLKKAHEILRLSIQRLAQGYLVTKYAAKGWDPHEKYVKIVDDNKFLSFTDKKNSSDVKKVPIDEMLDIKYP